MTLPLWTWREERVVMHLADGVELVHHPGWLPAAEADAALLELRNGIPWRQEMFRPGVPLPRLTAWWGERPYLYSGIVNASLPPSPIVEAIRQRVEAEVGHHFSSCLANIYRDGQDCVGWHADDERGLEPDPVIASVSFGATRRFVLRHKTAPKVELKLGHGDLLAMGGIA